MMVAEKVLLFLCLLSFASFLFIALKRQLYSESGCAVILVAMYVFLFPLIGTTNRVVNEVIFLVLSFIQLGYWFRHRRNTLLK